METRLLAADELVKLETIGLTVELSIEGEAGKINPSTAKPRLLERHLLNLGIPANRHPDAKPGAAQRNTITRAVGLSAKDFNDLWPADLIDRGNGAKTETLPDGRDVNIHDSSQGDMPNIEAPDGNGGNITIMYP